ncbi:MAG: hypothetical protein R3C53_04240 [Pirellulaceae bacterium]
MPIELEDLKEKLTAESQRRRITLLDAPELAKAFYVARLDGGVLTSDYSRWDFSGALASRPLTLGRVSVALGDVRRNESLEQLSDYARFSPVGEIEVKLADAVNQLWFSFLISAAEASDDKTFFIELPSATIATMLISTPANIELESPDVLIEEVSDPATLLPADWPEKVENRRPVGAASRWWAINIAAQSKFTLRARSRLSESALWLKHTLESVQTDYVVNSRQIEAAYRAKFATSSDKVPVRVRLSRHLRVKSLLVDGLAARWKPAASLSGDSNLIELIDIEPVSGTEVEIIAIAENTAMQIALPTLEIAEAFTIAGSTQVRAGGGLRAANVVADIGESSSAFEPTLTIRGNGASAADSSLLNNLEVSSEAELDDLVWIGKWSGTHPNATVTITQRASQWQANVFSRFTIQAASHSINSRVKLSCDRLVANEIRLQVGKGWFVDDINVVGGSQNDVRAEFVEEGSGQNPRTEIVVSWDRLRSSIQLELEIAAHSPREKGSDRVQFRLPRLLELPGARQQDTFSVQTAGRYRLQPNEELLLIQKQPRELPEWQQILLPQLSDVWVFEGNGQEMPDLQFVASEGAFTCKLLAFAQEGADGMQVNYEITCQPVSGTVEQLTLLLPTGIPASQFTFELQVGDENPVPVTHRAVAEVVNEKEHRVQVVLPSPLATTFILRAKRDSESQNSETQNQDDDLAYELIMPGVRGAIAAESTIMLPKSLTRFQGQPMIELLPAAACCSDQQLQDMGNSSVRSLDALVAARMDASESHRLDVRKMPSSASDGWIWQASVDHRVWDDGSQTHTVLWDIERVNLHAVPFKLPPNWQLDIVRLNGKRVEPLAMDDGRFRVLLPPGLRAQLTLECSTARNESWLGQVVSQVELASPTTDLPILGYRTRCLLPPNRISLESLLSTPRSETLLDRLHPREWWALLSPSVIASSSVDKREPNWSRFETSSAADLSPLWALHRSALAAFCLSSVLVAGTLAWYTLGRSLRSWWLTICCLAVLLILVPVSFVAFVQLLLLACVMSALARLAQVVIVRNHGVRSGSIARAASRRVEIRNLVSILICAMAIGVQSRNVVGQEPFPNRQSPSETILNDEVSAEDTDLTIYGVLLPVDPNGETTRYAHIPTKLWERLAAPTQRSAVGPPKLLSANYLLRTMRPATIGQAETVQEFSVQYLVQVTEQDTELRLPFNALHLRVVEARVRDQAVYVGLSKLKQLDDAVVFHPDQGDIGTISLSLRFAISPDTEELPNGKSGFSVGVPSVPTARLRILSSGASDFQVNAIGGTERTAAGELLAHLGPIDKLSVTWNDTPRRPSTAFPTDVASETWIDSQGSRVVAACQLRIGPDQSLSEIVHVYVDAEWEPVGNDWGDGQLLDTETTAFGKRRVYTLQLPAQPATATARVIRVLLVPRRIEQTASLPLPFLSLQEVSQQSLRRVLAWSSDAQGVWKPDGVDFWPEFTSSASNWGPLKLSDQRRMYRVPPGSGQLQIRKQEPTASIVNEITSVHLNSVHERIEYRATWAANPPSTLRLLLPAGATVETLLIDGKKPVFRTSDQVDQPALLVSLAERRGATINELNLVLSRPMAFGKLRPLSRVILQNTVVEKSQFRLFRGASLQCELRPDPESIISLEPVAMSSTTLLDNLEVPVGEMDLGSALRDQAELPVSTMIQPRHSQPCEACVMTLRRGADGWGVTLFAQWPVETKVDFAFFDLPVNVRDTVNAGASTRKFIPSADSSRTTLCVLPAVAANGKQQVTLSFPLEGVSPQSLTLPKIQLLNDIHARLVVGLPKQIDGQKVRWKRAGPRLENDWQTQLELPLTDEFEFYASEDPIGQVNWQADEQNDRQARVESVHVRMSTPDTHFGDIDRGRRKGRTVATGMVDYWVIPRGQLELPFEIPENCEVLGAEVGGSSAVWSVSQRRLVVQLHPNFMPVNVRLLTRWRVADPSKLALQPPKPTADTARSGLVLMVSESPGWNVLTVGVDDQTPLASKKILLERWLNLVANTLQVHQGLSKQELGAWLATWSPSSFELDPGLSVERSTVASLDLNIDDSVALTLGDLWTALGTAYSIPASAESEPQRDQRADSWLYTTDRIPIMPLRMYVIKSDEFVLELDEPDVSLVPRLLASGLVALAGILMLILAQRVSASCMQILAIHPWLYWLGLSAIAWLLLPVTWPSVVIGIVAVSMFAGQSFDVRSRSRTASRL